MGGFVDPIIVNRFNKSLQAIFNNQFTMRGQSSSPSIDRRRDIAAECGFPPDGEINPKMMRDWYERDALWARVVEVWPKECWQTLPEIIETNDNEITTPFELAWDQLGSSLVNEPGYHNQEKGSSVWEYLQRADVLCGVGRYGVILLGLNDGKDLREPVQIQTTLPQSSPDQNTDSGQTFNSQLKLNFIRVFDESQAVITARETNKTSPRFGYPTEYEIMLDDPSLYESSRTGSAYTTTKVHWTRVVHIVDNFQNTSTNEIIGQYRAKPVLNDLLTAQKSRWGSGEMFWNGASPKLSFETHPQLGGDVMINKSRMKDQIELALRGLQQWWILQGMTAKTIAPVAVDPKPFIDAPIQSICIKLGIPVPVFIGYEVGENAGTMNSEEWNKRKQHRNSVQTIPRVICPFVNRLINIGVLPVPTEGYLVDWPEGTSQNENERTDIQTKRMNILSAWVKNGLERVLPLEEVLVRFLDMEQEEAQMLADKARAETQKQQTIEKIIAPDPTSSLQEKPIEGGTAQEVEQEEEEQNPSVQE